MDATCKNCNHWEDEQVQQDNLGECDVLGTAKGGMFVLPVINSQIQSAGNFLTNADFGCNQFSAV